MASKRKTIKAILPAKMPKPPRVRDTNEDMPEPYTPPDEHNVRMRKISNGHIIREHGYEGGKSFEREHYSQTKPKLLFEQKSRAARLAGKRI